MLWKVPVTIATSKNAEALKFVLEDSSTTVTVEGVGPDDWILVSQISFDADVDVLPLTAQPRSPRFLPCLLLD